MQFHKIGSILLFSSIVLATVAVISSTWLHLSVMRWISGGMAKVPLRPFNRVMLAVLILFVAHFGGIVIYATGFVVGHKTLNLGGFSGEAVETLLDYFYFSAVSYTSLGLGDIFPKDHLRFLTGVEALNGLLLIAWSGAFLFAMMNRLWDWPPCAEPDEPKK
ncbi:MAG: ion channel [Roseovarius sp.]|nr:ion channel [Roseovarius sp.]